MKLSTPLQTALRHALALFTRHGRIRGRARLATLLGPFLIPPGGFDRRDLEGFSLPLDLTDENQRLMFYGLYEAREVRLLKTFVRPGDVFFDIGANVGFYTILARGLVGPSGAVHAFEPLPANFRRLELVVRENGLTNVFLNQTAVGKANDRLQLYTYASSQGDTSAMASLYSSGDDSSVMVDVLTLDSYVTRHNISRIDCIKLDIEGAEWHAFQGMHEVLTRIKPQVIFTELWHPAGHVLHHGGQVPKELREADRAIEVLLRDLGYLMTRVDLEPAPDGVENIVFVRR